MLEKNQLRKMNTTAVSITNKIGFLYKLIQYQDKFEFIKKIKPLKKSKGLVIKGLISFNPI